MRKCFARNGPLPVFLLCALLVSMLLRNVALATSELVTIPSSGTVEAALSATTTTTFSGGKLTISGNDSVTLNRTADITSVELKFGSLSIKSAVSSLTVTGSASTQTTLSNEQSGAVAIVGQFYQVFGPVTLQGATTITSGNVTITGQSSLTGLQNLTIRGGTVNLSGAFNAVTVEGGTITIAGDTHMENLKITSGEINVGAKKTLNVNGKSVTPEAGVKFTASEWAGGSGSNPKLPVSADGYGNVSGTWQLNGDAKIMGAQTPTFANGKFTFSTDPSTYDAHIYVPSGATLTLADNAASTPHKVEIPGPATAGNLNIGKGYKVSVNSAVTALGDIAIHGANSTVELPQNLAQSGDLTISAGTVNLTSQEKLTAGTVTLDGGSLTFPAGSRVAGADKRTIENAANTAITLLEWGTLPSVASLNVALDGEWNLASGIAATVSKANATGGAKTIVNGLGGSLTPSSANVYAKGYFAALSATSSSPLNISETDTVCTPSNSIYTSQEASLVHWPTVPGDSAATTYQTAPAYKLTGEWNIQSGDKILVIGTTCVCGNSAHTHGNETTIANDGASESVVWFSGGTVKAAASPSQVKTASVSNGQSGESPTMVGDGTTTLDSSNGSTNVKGEFQSVTGTVTLVGPTTIHDGTVTVTGNGQALAIDGGTVSLIGEFSSLKTLKNLKSDDTSEVTDGEVKDGDITVKLAGDVAIQGGAFSIADPDAKNYVVTVTGGTGEINGKFKQLTVTGGELIDSGALTLKNVGTCLSVSGGKVTLNDKPDIQFTESAPNAQVIAITGGELHLMNGTVIADGQNAIAAHLGDGKFYLGEPDNQKPYNDEETPTLKLNGAFGAVVDVGAKGEAWLQAGEIYFDGESARGVSVSGNVHLYPNEQYGDATVSDTLLYIHGANQSTAAMWINAGGNFDIRGRGVLLEEPSPYNDSKFALYIHADSQLQQKLNGENLDKFPLSGGSFHGKVYYDQHDLADLIAPNHYLRYDGEARNYGATDGTYGVVVSSAADRADAAKNYGSYEQYYGKTLDTAALDGDNLRQFGKHGVYYSIADAEWELRVQMATENGRYQIPAGIVNRNNDGTSATDNPDGIILDTNAFELTNPDSPATSVWGMGKKKGDAEVTGTGHVLYFAGRKISYTEKNRNGDALSGIWTTAATDGNGYDHADNTLGGDASNILYLNAGAALDLRDCVYGKDGVDAAADKTTGGYIGTGTLARRGSDEPFCRAIYNGGALNVISAQILSTKEAIFTVKGSTTNIGENDKAYGELTNGEDNSNNLIDIIGDVISVSIEGADAVNAYGGVVGDVNGAEKADAVGIENRDNDRVKSKLNVYGGIIAGSGPNGVGIRTTGETGVTTIHGGCIYGKYADDAENATDLSLHVNGGTVYLNMDEAHGISKNIPGERFLTTTAPEGNQTSATHHIGNVKTENGKLYVGVDKDQDVSTLVKPKAEKDVSEHTRINGTLDCVGGSTVFYQGVVAGKTTVTGKDTGKDFTTEFFVNDGHFADLAIKGGMKYTFQENATGGAKRLNERVQIHGGAYQSISTANLANGIGVQEILGFWNSAYDMDEKTASTAKDWIRYNHYAERNVTGTRDNSGYWIGSDGGWIKDVPANLSDAGRAPNDATLTAAEGSAIVVRDALWEFNDWLTKDNPGDVATLGEEYALAVNLWLDASNAICTDYFHCAENVAPQYPLKVGAGKHQVDVNDWGIFGKYDGALIQNQSSSELILTNTAAPSQTATPAYERRIRNLSTSSDAQVIAAEGGTLTLQRESDRAKGALILRAAGVPVTLTTGTFTMNAGFLDGGKNGLEITGAGTVFLTSDSANKVVTADGTPTGRIVTLAETDGITIEGRANDGVINAGQLTVTGVDGKQVKIAGTNNGVTLNAGGWISAAYAEITGAATGMESGSETRNENGEGDTVTLDNVKLTGNAQNGLTLTKGTLYAKDSVITGEATALSVVNDSGLYGKAGDTVTLDTVTLTGTTANGLTLAKGTLYAKGGAITGKVTGIHSDSGLYSKTATANGANETVSETMRLEDVTVTGTDNYGIEMTQGTLYMENQSVTGGQTGILSTSAAQNENGQGKTMNLKTVTVIGTSDIGLSNASGTVFADKVTITGGQKGIVNASGLTALKETDADKAITVKLSNACVVTGTANIGVESNAGTLDVTASTISGGPNYNGVSLSGSASASVHAGTQITGNGSTAPQETDTLPALLCESSGKVLIDGGSLAKGLGYGVEQKNGEFEIVGGNLGAYTMSDSAVSMTVKNGENGSAVTIPSFVSVTQSAGKATVSGSATMGKYTHTGGTVIVNANPNFTSFTGEDNGSDETKDVTLNSGHYQTFIENKSGKLNALLGPNAIVICDGGATGGSYSQDESTEQAIGNDVLDNQSRLATDTYTTDSGKINLAAPFSINSNKLDEVKVEESNLPTKTEYIVGEELQWAGAKLTLIYEDGQTRTLDLSFLDEEPLPERADEITYSGFDAETVGEQKITVSYKRDKTNGEEEPLTCTFKVKVYDRELVSIAIETPPTKLNYLQDASPANIDRAGGVVTLNYNYGEPETKNLTDEAFTIGGGGAEFDASKVGTQIVKVSYTQTLDNDLQKKEITKQASFTISVLNKDISSFKITQNPDKTEYLEGDADTVTLDLTGCKVTLNYYDGTKQENADVLSLGDLITPSGFNPRKIGEQTVTLTYQQEGGEEHKATFTVTVKARTPVSLKVSDDPKNGSEFLEKKGTPDFTGGKLKIAYDNGDTKEISMTASGVTVSRGLDNTQLGAQTILFAYTENGVTVETPETHGWNVTVVSKTLKFISMTTLPAKSEYVEGKDELDLSGAKLKLVYDNGDEETVDLEGNDDFEVTGFDNAETGQQHTEQLTVQHKTLANISTVFSVTITPKSLASIEVKTAPTNPNYKNNPLDLTGGALLRVYDNGTSEEMSMEDEAVKITGYDSSPSKFADGQTQITQTLTATYNGKNAAFEVTILNEEPVSAELTAESASKLQQDYYQGQTLNLSGGELSVTYNSGRTETVPLTSSLVEVLSFDNEQPGEQSVSLKYGSLELENLFTVNVIAKEVVKISIQKRPTKVSYLEGEELDLSGGNLSVLYNSGDSAELPMTDSMIAASGFLPYEFGEQSVTLTYQDTECSCELTGLTVGAPYKLTVVKKQYLQYLIEVKTPTPETDAVLTLTCYDSDERMTAQVQKPVDLSVSADLLGILEPPEGVEGCAMTLSLTKLSTGVSLCEAAQIPAS